MPKVVKWSGTAASDIDDVEVKEYGDFEPYDGPMPLRGMILKCDVKRITAEKFNTGTHGVNCLFEVNEDEPKKAKYNGLAYWKSIVDGPSTAFLIRQLMDALGSTSPGADWHKTTIESVDGVNRVVKFGNIRVEGKQVLIVHKTERDQNDDPKAAVGFIRPLRAGSGATAKARAASKPADDDNEDDDSEAPF